MNDKMSFFEICAGGIGLILALFFFLWVICTPDKKNKATTCWL